jgi:adhesin/invasin
LSVYATFNPPTVGVNGESNVTITFINTVSNEYVVSFLPDDLPDLPANLEFTDGPKTGTCTSDRPMNEQEQCQMKARVKALAAGSFEWSGIGGQNDDTLNLTSSAPLVVYQGPATISIVAGSSQSAQVGNAFAEPLTVEVRDSNSVFVTGAEVTFTAPSEGAAATFNETIVQTDAEGRAGVAVSANDSAGPYVVQATVSDALSSAEFALKNTAPPSGLEATVSYYYGSNDTGIVTPDTVLGANITVKNTSQATILQGLSTDDLPALPSGLSLVGQPEVGDCGSHTLSVGSTCQMTVMVTASEFGNYKWTGTGPTNTNTNTNITLTDATGVSVYGDPATITVVSGSDQSARAGTAFALPLVVEVKDSNDIVVPGVTVTFAAPADGPAATFDQTTVQTGSAGRASVTVTANDLVGDYVVGATVSGVNATAEFGLSNSPLPSKLEATVSYSTAAIASGGEAAATIRITNTSGSTLQHALFASDLPALPDGLALVGQANPGTCTSEYMPLANRNYCEMAATVTSETLGTHKWTGNGQENTANSAYIALTDANGVSVYGEPATITVVSGNEQSVLVSTAFALPLVVEVRDSNDIVVPGVEVTFTAPGNGPSATFDPSTNQTNAEGRASTTATANTSQGDFAVQASVSGVDSSAGFALFNIRLPFELTATVSYSAASIASGGEATATIRITNTSNIMLQSAPPTTDLPALPSGLSMVGEADQGTCAGQYMPLSPGSYCQMTATVTSTTLGTHKWTGNGQQNAYNNAYIALTDADGLGVYSTATTVTVSDGDDQSVAVGGSFAMLSVRVTDANGIGVPDVEVTFTAPASGASVTQPETAATTDGSGLSSVSLTANQTAGA